MRLATLTLAFSLAATAVGARVPVALPERIPAELDLREVDQTTATQLVRRLAVPAAPTWLSASSIALLPGDEQVAVADADNGAVVISDVRTGAILHSVKVGERPERLVAGPDGVIYVASRGARAVTAIDGRSGKVLRTAQVGAEPYAVALTPDATTLLVSASASGELVALDAGTFAVRYRLPLSAWPGALAVHPSGARVYVTHLLSGVVDEVDVASGKVLRALSLPDHGTGFPRTAQATDDARAPVHAAAALVSPGGTRLFVAHVMVDVGAAETTPVAQGYGVGVARPLVATVSTLDLESGRLLRSPVSERGVDVTTLRDKRFLTVEQESSPFGFVEEEELSRLSQPVALVMDPVFARLLLVSMGSDRVTCLDASTADPIGRPLQGIKVGQAPRGVAISRDGKTAYVHNAHDFSVSRVDLSAAPFSEEFRYDLASAAPFAIGKDPLTASEAMGRRLFTYALDERVGGPARFACGGCHPDGRHDGLVWRVGEGPRQTPILAGRLAGTAPYNWLGTEAELTHNIAKTIGRLGGSGLDEPSLNALADYVSHALPDLDNPHQNTQTALVARGKALFESAETGCSGCHTGVTGDGARHEVGTTTEAEERIFATLAEQGRPQAAPPGGPSVPKPPIAYDTPSLHHLWASAPYFHDGRAATLTELLTHANAGDRMGRTSHLSRGDVDALAAYLSTL